MNAFAAEYWPWLALVGLGLFHGANPAMGWLFAVALGMNRESERVVFASLLPIALGHAAAVALVVVAVLGLGIVIDAGTMARIAGVLLVAFAVWHAIYGHRQRIRIGMQTGLAGLLVWSFLMANAHGAGLMVVPVLLPICMSGSAAATLVSGKSAFVAIGALAVHSATMLATIALISITVYRWAGLGFLKRAWINLDLIWTFVLGACGLGLLLAA